MSSDNHGISLKVRIHSQLGKAEAAACKKAMRLVMRVMKATSSSRRGSKSKSSKTGLPRQIQRAAVRVTYVGQKSAGLWKAHGSYLQRESATGKEQAGFTATENGVNVPKTLESWQSANDPRLFKIILSPEFGEGIEMERYTRSVMEKIQSDVRAPLEWVAVAHYNTDHAHVHVALRSITKDDKELKFPKEYIREGIRIHAQIAATDQIGHRSELDIKRAREREVTQPRLTSLDRAIARLKPDGINSQSFDVTINPRATKELRADKRAEIVAMAARLRNLETMGLATSTSTNRWTVRPDFAEILKTIQSAGDRQRTYARQMALASDMNLPFVAEDWRKFESLQGRILGHGEDEAKGKHFMLIEGTDGRIHYLTHRKETEQLRSASQLRVNQFVSIAKDHGTLRIHQYGDSERLLSSTRFLSMQPLPAPTEFPRPGWLGKLDQAVMLNSYSKETIRMSNTATIEGKKPLLLSPAQVSEYLVKSNIVQDDAHRIASMIEGRQRFNTDLDGVRLDYNMIELGGQEGMALYASVSPAEREKVLTLLGIDDTAVQKEERLWTERQAAERERRQNEAAATAKEVKPDDLEAAKTIGEEIFPGENFQVFKAHDENSQYKGEVAAVTDNYIIMNDGEDLILHSKDKFDRIPEVGKRIAVQYGSPRERSTVTTLPGKQIHKNIEI